MKEKVQGALGVVTALASMYLFSVLGVEGAPNGLIGWVGLAGGATMGAAGMIEVVSIAYDESASTEGDGQAGTLGSWTQPSNVRVASRLSLGDVEENMTFAGLV